MKKWEYATVPLMIHTTKAILDNWGEDGWELVTVLPRCLRTRRRSPPSNMVAPTQGNPIAYFKARRPTKRRPLRRLPAISLRAETWLPIGNS